MLAHLTVLDDWLATKPTAAWMADLYTITLVDGTVLRMTDFGRDLVYGGNTFAGANLGISRSKIKREIGLTTSTCEVTLITDGTVTIGSQPLLAGMAQGRWDAAAVLIQRILMPSPGDVSKGAYIWFGGTVGSVSDRGSLSVKFEVRGPSQRMNRPIPNLVFSPSCCHELFDAGCGLNANTYAETGTVQAGTTAAVIQSGITDHQQNVNPPAAPVLSYVAIPGLTLNGATYSVVITYTTAYGETVASPESSLTVPANCVLQVAAPANVAGNTGWNCYISTSPGDEQLQNQAPLGTGAGVVYAIANTGIALSGIFPPSLPTTGWWSQGTIQFTSGVLNGLTAMINTSDNSGALTLVAPLPQAPASGDGFRILPGCAKAMFVCANKFSNLVHFNGVPFTPTPETAA